MRLAWVILLIFVRAISCSESPSGSQDEQPQRAPVFSAQDTTRRHSHCLSLQHQILSSMTSMGASPQNDALASSWEDRDHEWCRVTFKTRLESGAQTHRARRSPCSGSRRGSADLGHAGRMNAPPLLFSHTQAWPWMTVALRSRTRSRRRP